MRLAGTLVECRPSGALWLPEARALVAADLHLEKGSAFARRGQLLPPYDTRETLDRLCAEIAALAPRLLVLLGDSFHDLHACERLAADDRARLDQMALGRTVVWVTGNHDENALVALPGDVVASIILAGLVFLHEPTTGFASAEVAGHYHPCARVQARGGRVRRRCFVTDGQRMVLPAFGALAGGLNVRDPALARLLRPAPLALVLGADRLHVVGWASLRGD
jgi:DNA ligase-associated metallophosphoesterase